MHKILHTLAAAPVLPPLKCWFECWREGGGVRMGELELNSIPPDRLCAGFRLMC